MIYTIRYDGKEWETNDRKMAYEMFDILIDRYPTASMTFVNNI